MTQPDKQLEQLAEMMTSLNKGNASTDEVASLFEVVFHAIEQIRTDLEAKISETGSKAEEDDQKTLSLLDGVYGRLNKLISETGTASKSNIDALKKAFKAELENIRKSIPTMPDFEEMFRTFESKIPEPAEPIEYKAGKNIEIDGNVINCTNPTITVSRTKPSNPQEGDLWIRPLS